MPVNMRYLAPDQVGGVRLADNSPGPRRNVSGRDSIGRASEPTRDALELGLGWPIALFRMPALGAFSAGIARIDQDYGDTGSFGFVENKLPELMESPISQSGTLALTGRYPITDTAQFFQGDSAIGALSGCHDGFTNAVVGVLLVTRLTTLKSAQFAFGSTCSLALQVTAAVGVDATIKFHLLAAVVRALAVRGDVNDTEVNPKHITGFDQIGIVQVTNTSDVEHATDQHQIDFAFAVFEQFSLVLAHYASHFFPTVQRPNRNRVIVEKPEDAVIVGLRRVRSEGALCLGVELIGIGHLGNAAHRDLSTQTKAFPRLGVNQLVQRKLLERLDLPGTLRNPVAGSIGALKSFLERFKLLCIRQKFNVGYKFHIFKYGRFSQHPQLIYVTEAAIPPLPKGSGLLAENR